MKIQDIQRVQRQGQPGSGRRTGASSSVRPGCARSDSVVAGITAVVLCVVSCEPAPSPTPVLDPAATAATATTATTATGAEGAAATIQADDMRARISVIAHDVMAGRATPSPGLDLTASYIASEFATMGLQPVTGDGSFILWYDIAEGARPAPNVVAVLPGSDPRLSETFVVFSAHMDHVGIGAPDASGDSIYNGADDDASGTAAILEIAEAFSRLSTAPARSIAFVAVSGEENGLLGSRAFLDGQSVPPDRMVADINIDMISRNTPDTIVVVGMRYSDLGDRATRVAARERLGLTVSDDLWPDERFFFRSDHYNFAQAGIPAVFFFSGVHEDYHMPSDEADRIDADKAARVARLAFFLGLDIANDEVAPDWTREGLREVRPGRN